MSIPIEVNRYLKKHNLNPWEIELKSEQLFNHIIVIPALDELENIPILLDSLSLNSKKYLAETLVLVIINNTVSTKRTVIEENISLLNYLRTYTRENSCINLGIIDAASEGKELPEKSGGVGFARKIGMDLALKLFNYDTDKKKILISLDADCLVAENYLQKIVGDFNNNDLHAAIVNFQHTLPEDNNQKAAIINYEIFLRYYVLGLIYAKSQYAHLSVGSTIICDVESYVKIGGMNKRKAGEDFYFLEKLAKLSKINKVADTTVFPSARVSSRVPFGTGVRIKRFLTGSTNEYLIYSPKCFEILRIWLNIYNEKITLSTSQKDISKILKETKIINSDLYLFLVNNNFEENWNKILNNTKTDEQLYKQKINWMDGFRTLKLIHHLRDNHLPNENTFSALNQLFKTMNFEFDFTTNEIIPPLEVQLEYLKFLRKLT
jgi:hypothetical protein